MANIIESKVTLEDEVFEETIDTMEEPIEVVRPSSYEDLEDLPQVNGVTLMGNKTSEELGIVTTTDIENAVSAEATLRENADTALGGRIDQEITARGNADTALGGRIDGEITNRTNADNALGTRIDNEILARQGEDNNLQTQIDAITSKSDVVDVVADYAALQAYDTQHLGNNDVIKVLDDETHNDAQTYYRWNKTAGTWSYIGSEAPYYSKGQIDQQMQAKQDKLTAGTGISLDGATISADTTVLATKEDLEPEIVADLPTVGDTTKLYLTPTNKTASGNPITIDLKEDVGQMTSFRLDGDTFQQSYTGKNLFNDATAINSYIQSNGSVTPNDVWRASQLIKVSPNTSYIWHGEVYGVHQVVWAGYDGNNAFISGQYAQVNNVASLVIVTGVNTEYLRVGYRSDGMRNMQLELGSTATSFEPYVGGQPSPSPDYPQPIQTVTGEQVVNVTGKNLWGGFASDFSKTSSGVTFVNKADGTITANGTANGTALSLFSTDAISRNRLITLSAGDYIISGATAVVRLEVINTSGGVVADTSGTISGEKAFSISEQMQVAVRAKMANTYVADNVTIKPMLEKGSTATTYAPYSKQTLPISLGSIELCKLGTYQDYIYKDGDGWKIHKATAIYSFTGEETPTVSTSSTNTTRCLINNLLPSNSPAKPENSGSGASNYFVYRLNWSSDEQGIYANNRAVVFRGNKTTIGTTLGEVQTWLTANKPSLYYALDTPTDTIITDQTLIAQLEAIRTAALGNGTNTITNTATGANLAGSMSIGYYGYNPSEYSEWLYIDGAWEQVGGRPIPTKTSELTNDSEFVDEDDIALKLQNEVVSELPENGDEGKLYLTPKDFYIQSSNGNPTSINIENRAGAIDGITIGGNTTQTTYTGKNLVGVNMPNVTSGYTGLTASVANRVANSGSFDIVLSGSVQASLWSLYAVTDSIQLEPNTKYTLSRAFTTTGTAYAGSGGIRVKYGSSYTTTTTASSATFTTDSTGTVQLLFYAVYNQSGPTRNIDTTISFTKVQLEKSETASSFEPYVGGMPSPNPNYPQSIHSISGEHTINIDSVNLFDKSQITEGYYLNSTGEEVSNEQWSYSDYIPVIPGQSYTVSGFLVNANAPKECFYDENKNFVSSISHVAGNTTIVIPSGCYYIRLNLFYRPPTEDELSVCQFQKGTSATTYTEYYKKSFTINLGSLYLRKIGTYADQIYYDNGWKLKTAIGMKTIKGNETTIDRTGANVFRFTQLLNNTADKAQTGSGASSHFVYNPVQVSVTGTLAFGEFAIQNGDHPFFKIDSSIDTVEACRTWFAGHNTIIIYPLKNQRVEDITDQTLIDQLDAIRAEILGMGGYTVKIDTQGSLGAQYHSYNPNDLYDEWLYIDGRYEKIPLSQVDGGYEFINSADANNRLWKIWNARLAYGMDTATAAVPSYFNSSVVSNGMVIAHNTGDRTSNRWGLHLFEGYSKDNYGRLTMLLDKFTENDKKSCAIYYFDGANEHASSYDNVKLGSDCVGHSFNFDRDEMTAYGAVFCNMPLTLARIDPATDLNRTYETVEEVDAAYHPEGSMVNNVKCLKYIYLKNAPDGTMWYDTARNKIVVKINGEWHDMNTTAVPEGTYDF